MTKDSICKDCEHRVEVSGSFTQKVTRTITTNFLHRFCKVRAINEDDLDPDIHKLRVLKCSEFSRKITKIPPPDPRRFHVIEQTRRIPLRRNRWLLMIKEVFYGKT